MDNDDFKEIDAVSTTSFQACPYSWFHLSEDDECNCRHVWKLIFLSVCLPVCYPCYISRAIRSHCIKKNSVPPYLAVSALSPSGRHKSTCSIPQSPTTTGHPLLSPRPSVCLSSEREHDLVITSIFLRTESSFTLLNRLSLEIFNKEQTSTKGVVGRASVTVNNFSAELHLCQEILSYDESAVEVDASTLNQITDLDIVVIVVEEEDILYEMLSRSKGLIPYIKKYWQCYYPVLLVTLPPLNPDIVFKKTTLEKIEEIFSKTHHLRLKDGKLEKNLLLEVITQFYQHIYTCSTLEEGRGESLRNPDWNCLGNCGLKSKGKEVNSKTKRLLAQAKRRLMR